MICLLTLISLPNRPGPTGRLWTIRRLYFQKFTKVAAAPISAGEWVCSIARTKERGSDNKSPAGLMCMERPGPISPWALDITSRNDFQ